MSTQVLQRQGAGEARHGQLSCQGQVDGQGAIQVVELGEQAIEPGEGGKPPRQGATQGTLPGEPGEAGVAVEATHPGEGEIQPGVGPAPYQRCPDVEAGGKVEGLDVGPR